VHDIRTVTLKVTEVAKKITSALDPSALEKDPEHLRAVDRIRAPEHFN
jgi:hypothetical protein